MSKEYSENDPFKHYFKMDVGWINEYLETLSKMIQDQISEDEIKINNIKGFPNVSLPVSGYFPINTVGGQNSPLYLGNNHHNDPIFKNQHMIKDSLKIDYINHLTSNAVHFLSQPTYYNGMFDILN